MSYGQIEQSRQGTPMIELGDGTTLLSAFLTGEGYAGIAISSAPSGLSVGEVLTEEHETRVEDVTFLVASTNAEALRVLERVAASAAELLEALDA